MTEASCASDLEINDPWADLSPTAQRILRTAKKIIAEQGLRALTFEAIAEQAKVNKAATRYHFGSKAGLLESIVDEIVLTQCATIATHLPAEATMEERIEAFVEHIRYLLSEPIRFGGFFDVVPHAVHTEALRKRLSRLYEIWFDSILEWLGLPRQDVASPEVLATARLAAAVFDGLSVQALFNGNEEIPKELLELLRRTLTVLVSEVAPVSSPQGLPSPNDTETP